MIRDMLTWPILVLIIGLMMFTAWVGFASGSLMASWDARNAPPPVADFYKVAGETCFRGSYVEIGEWSRWSEVRL